MKRVPAAEFVRNFSALCDEALSQPVVVTRNGRDRLVVVKAEYFRELAARPHPNDASEDIDEARRLPADRA